MYSERSWKFQTDDRGIDDLAFVRANEFRCLFQTQREEADPLRKAKPFVQVVILEFRRISTFSDVTCRTSQSSMNIRPNPVTQRYGISKVVENPG